MNSRRIFDILFVCAAFGVYLLVLNTDKSIDNANFLSRHIWLPLIIAYYLGRLVSSYKSDASVKKQGI